MSETEEISLLRSFVRGETQWDGLAILNVRLSFDSDGLHLEEPADAPVYEATAGDVATGLVSHWAVGTSLQEWARVLLATGMIDLGRLEDHPDGEVLLEALWDAAEASRIDEQRLGVAQQLAASE